MEYKTPQTKTRQEVHTELRKLKNTPDERIQELLRENQELKLKLQRSQWKTRNQRSEISRLNSANIHKIHLLRKREERIDALTHVKE